MELKEIEKIKGRVNELTAEIQAGYGQHTAIHRMKLCNELGLLNTKLLLSKEVDANGH